MILLHMVITQSYFAHLIHIWEINPNIMWMDFNIVLNLTCELDVAMN